MLVCISCIADKISADSGLLHVQKNQGQPQVGKGQSRNSCGCNLAQPNTLQEREGIQDTNECVQWQAVTVNHSENYRSICRTNIPISHVSRDRSILEWPGG